MSLTVVVPRCYIKEGCVNGKNVQRSIAVRSRRAGLLMGSVPEFCLELNISLSVQQLSSMVRCIRHKRRHWMSRHDREADGLRRWLATTGLTSVSPSAPFTHRNDFETKS